MFSSVSPARGATFAQKQPSIFMIFERHVPSIGRNSKEIDKFFERGPEIQKVVKNQLHYFREGRVRGPASRMASQKRFQGNSEGLKVRKKNVKYSIFVVFVTNERSLGRNSSEIERAKK